MAQQLEQDQSQWQQNMNDKDLMSNEVVPVNTFSSPESQWSDTSGNSSDSTVAWQGGTHTHILTHEDTYRHAHTCTNGHTHAH